MNLTKPFQNKTKTIIMSQLAKLSSKLAHLPIGSVCNNSVRKAPAMEFSNLGIKCHTRLASLNLVEHHTVIMSCPPDLQDEIGTDRYFAETDDTNTITAVAATIKLLAEERLRRETNALHVPINQILQASHHQHTPSPLMVKMTLADL